MSCILEVHNLDIIILIFKLAKVNGYSLMIKELDSLTLKILNNNALVVMYKIAMVMDGIRDKAIKVHIYLFIKRYIKLIYN